MTKIDIGPFDQTWFANEHGYDIAQIRPYAAYDVVENTWIVKPVHLPHWSWDEIPKAVQAELKAVRAYVRSVLRLPEPLKTQQGAALFEHLHSARSRAFSDRGTGWFDPSNLVEKMLDQEGIWPELVACAHRWAEGEGVTPDIWDNSHPFGVTASVEAPKGGALPFKPGKVFYRVHSPQREWGPEHAHSKPFGGDDAFGNPGEDLPAKPGYSSFDNPHDLDRYLTSQDWHAQFPRLPRTQEDIDNGRYHGRVDPAHARVVQFHGDIVGTGHDGEHLVMPHPSPDRRVMDVETFSHRLNRTPHPDVATHWHGSDEGHEYKGFAPGDGSECSYDAVAERCGHVEHHEDDGWGHYGSRRVTVHQRTGGRRNPMQATSGAAGPDYTGVTFWHTDGKGVGAMRSLHHHKIIYAEHPDHDGFLGHVRYTQEEGGQHFATDKPFLSVQKMDVHPEHQRRGVASQLMAELERTHPGVPIDHGRREPDGKQWAQSYYGTTDDDHMSVDRHTRLAATTVVLPNLAVGDTPPGIAYTRRVSSPQEALAAMDDGFTAVLPEGAWEAVRRVLLSSGMSQYDAQARLRLLQ